MTIHDLATLFDSYNKLNVPGWDRPELALVAVGVESALWPCDITGYQNVRDALTTDGFPGWVRLRSGMFISDESWSASNNGKLLSYELAGPPLAAEWAYANDASVHIRPASEPGKMQFRRYVERTLESKDALRDGEFAYLREKVSILRHPIPKHLGAKQPALVYHVFWGAPEDESEEDTGAISRCLSRFVGFETADFRINAGSRI